MSENQHFLAVNINFSDGSKSKIHCHVKVHISCEYGSAFSTKILAIATFCIDPLTILGFVSETAIKNVEPHVQLIERELYMLD